MHRIVLALLAVLCGIALGLGYLATSTSNTEDIEVGDITGTHGAEGAQLSGGSGESSVSRKYGFHCSGKECDGSDDPPMLVNSLLVTLTRAEGETDDIPVKATSKMTGKEAKQNTKDWHCPPPAGPPTWTAEGMVKLSNPGNGGGAGSDDDAGGKIYEGFSHSVSPQTAWHKTSQQNPVPGAARGTNYYDQTSDEESWTWEFDPENPSTDDYTVRADVKTDFTGTAKEIDVVDCYLRAVCTLSVTVN